MIGASIGGKMIRIGRLKVLYIASVIGMIGISLTMVMNIGVMLAGRILYGFATGLTSVAMPRYMEEVMPSGLIGLYGGLYCFSFAIAVFLAFLLAAGLPADKLANGDVNTEGLKASEFWRVIWGLPILCFLIQDTIAWLVCRSESPKFLLLEIEELQNKGSKSD